MSEVERRDPLAERINAEHRACTEAWNAALGHLYAAIDHAMNAGDLLLEAKAECSHGTWVAWLEDNFNGSVRRAQEYMYLARGRKDLEEAKARSPAFFKSIEGALEFLRAARHYATQEHPEPPPFPSLQPPVPLQARLQRARERDERRLMDRAEHAIRTGNLDPPLDLAGDAGKWDHVVYQVVAERRQNIPNVLDALAYELHILVNHARPEEVGKDLATAVNDPELAEWRADMLENYRDGVAWLTRVIEQAERTRGQKD